MYNLKIETDLGLSHHLDNLKLNKLIHASIKRKSDHHPKMAQAETTVFWLANQFLLDRSSLYQKLDPLIQQNILVRYNQVLMSDFYFLEKSGLAYCAKMILLGETTEIRQLYGLIAADEAMHLNWFTPYVKEEFRTAPQSKLLPVLGKIIDDCDANSLYYLVQSIIEGWGFMIYKTMADTCQCEEFRQILKIVLQDEAIHHHSGPALFNPNRINAQSAKMIYDRMKAYADVLRVGPQTLVQCIEQEIGELTALQIQTLFSEIKTELTSHLKLQILKKLMLQPQMESYVQQLMDDGYLRPYAANQCAKLYIKTRSSHQYV